MNELQGEFGGTARFEIRRRVGEGGMGVVYEAHDRDRDSKIALKILSNLDSSSIFRLKREFRALADLAHPNLVGYHELVSSGEFWFFTMELVDGVDFLTHVSGGAASGGLSTGSGVIGSTGPIDTPNGSSGLTRLSGAIHRGSSNHKIISKLPIEPRINDPSIATMAGLDLTRRLLVMSPVAATAAWESLTPKAVQTVRNTASFDHDKTLSWLDPAAKRTTPFSEAARIRPALTQVALGLEALHASGVQHRDVKPSNILVDRQGRVVILDFGLATYAGDANDGQTIQGTPAYMAPEQAYGAPSAASDLYALGVMLFEALTGRVPFQGTVYDIVAAKQLVDPPPPSSFVQGVDPALDRLCVDLLSRQADLRPRPADVLRRIDRGSHVPELRGRQKTRTMPFIGRESHMEVLREAAREVGEGKAITVTVHGISGMGKSALVRRFLDEVRQDQKALVLRGRCYERESVPYKAVDALMDALSRMLLSERPEKVTALLPTNMPALARLFPVLSDVPAVALVTRDKGEIPDVQELRRRGFGALRELFGRIAEGRLLVLAIDDLQWGDADSAALLSDLLRPPNSPPLLLVCSFRSDEAASSPFLRELINEDSAFRTAARGLDIRDVEVGPLTIEQSTELAQELLRAGSREGDAAAQKEVAADIAREAEGSPFFVAELTRALDRDDDNHLSEPPPSLSNPDAPRKRPVFRLDQVVQARVGRLSESARRLLEIVAVAGRPIEQAVALKAAGETNEAVPTLGILRSEHLVRTRGVKLDDLLESYHDRIREAVVQSLDVETKRARHLSLANVLESSTKADPETLAEHFALAQDRSRARKYAKLAAERARQALAFERAAKLYKSALDHTDDGDPSKWRTAKDLAGALANAGRGAEAWKIYEEAATDAPRADALELERLAAEHACRSGHIDEGLVLFRKVTAAIGMRMATSPAEALASLLARRALVRLRGLKYKEKSESSIAPEILTKLDVCYSVSVGLGMVDPIQGADFQARLLLLALEAGEPFRIARALAVEACYSSTGGESTRERTTLLIEAGEAIAKRVDNPLAVGTVESARAFDDVFVGRWRRGLAHAERAEQLLRDNCTSVAHEIATAQIFGLWALFNLGEIPELKKRYPEQLRHAEERGDLFAAGSKRTLIGHVVHLCDDDAAAARETVRIGMRDWSQGGFHVQHWYELQGDVNTDLYSGDREGAFKRIQSRWKEAERSLLMRIVSIRNDILFLRARAAVAAALTSPDKKKLLTMAEADAKKIGGADLANTEGWMRILRGSVFHQRGEKANAIAETKKAASAFQNVEMLLFAEVARRRVGQLIGGEEGKRIIERADAWMKERGIACPERIADTFAPGF